jgi:type IV pilus assembly protein PilN
VIRINLLGTERQKTRARTPVFDVGRQVTLACSLILVLGAAGIGYWYYSLTQESAQVDSELAAAQQEAARLRSLIVEVQQFDQRRTQLNQRVALIEQLRKGQSVPVQMLDLVSRSLPDMLWLTDMTQSGTDVTIQGRSTTLISLSDFVGNLAANDFFKKPVEIVASEVEPATAGTGSGASVDVINFTVRAQLATAPASGAAVKR